MSELGPTLCARGLRVTLGRRQVLHGVDFDAQSGQLSAIVGPNGSGKTTLLRAVAGLIPAEGRISVEGFEIGRLSPRERAQRIAYLPQVSALSAMLSVRQVVTLSRYASRSGWGSPGPSSDAAVEAALERTRLSALADHAYPRLSGGQQRLVLIARALATGARVLLLDEPTASLDVKHALQLFALLAELARDGYCVVLVLHDLDDVDRHADRVLLLEGGRVQAQAAPRDPTFVAAAERTYGVCLIAKDRLGFRLRGATEAPAGGGA